MSDEYIECYHPAAMVSATFTKRAFDEVWEDLGWKKGTLPEGEGGSEDSEGDTEEAVDPEEVVEEDIFNEA